MRIIAGQYKGRELLSLPGRQTTRPITGHVKKSLFGMLGEDLTGRTVLDLYCGTGTLGLEALSRGAVRCCFADRDCNALHLLKRNIAALGAAGRCTVWSGDIPARLCAWLGELTEPVDVAFVDPPYAEARRWDWRVVGETIFIPLARRLAADGVVVLRLPGRVAPPETLGPLVTGRVRDYGDMLIAMFVMGSRQEIG
jgi:16S rRNA (guanine966-N2)-methyltransferase